MKNIEKHIIVFLVFIFLNYFTAEISCASTFSEKSTMAKAGLVTASVITSTLYTPLKLAYAVTGTIMSGLVLGFTAGDEDEAATTIARCSVAGDWYVHPDVFLGSKKLNFVGPNNKEE